VENKDIKAHLPVPSERWGVVSGGGAMVRTVVAVSLRFVHREKKRKVGRRGDSGGDQREEG
jgi:hypothetical protein